MQQTPISVYERKILIKNFNKSILMVLTIALVISCLGNVSTFAIENNTNNNDIKISQLTETIAHNNLDTTEMGSASIKEAVVIGGIENYLYPTFDDIDMSLKNLEKTIPTYYKYVQKQANLKSLYESDYETVLQTNVFPENVETNVLDEKISNNSISSKNEMMKNTATFY